MADITNESVAENEVDIFDDMTDETETVGDPDASFDDVFVDDTVAETGETAEIVNPENEIEAPAPENEAPAPENEAPAPEKKPKGKPGRPRVYDDNHRSAFATMIERTGGMSQARKALIAHTGMTIDDVDGYDDIEKRANLERAHKWATDRDQTLFPADQSFPVSMVTLISVAKEYGIKLKAGRPKK